MLSPAPSDVLVERARDLLGASLLHPALVLEKTPEAACAAAVELLRGRPGATFAVRARRRDKGFRLDSRELATVVGRAVQDELGLGVDLTRPDLEIFVEVDKREIFAFTEKIPGRGGLPVGVSGRALVLLSGGIDSPVAAYRAMKRGLRCDYVHFSGRPYTGPESIYKSYAHVAALDRFQGGSRLFVVPFGVAQRRIAAAGAGRLQVLTQRRLMMKVASELARREGGEALVTGDSLGQVSSQTLHNMGVVERAADLPVLRPLVAWDKAEIVREAEEIGTYAVSDAPGRGLLHALRESARGDAGGAREAEHARGQARPGGDRRGARRGARSSCRPRHGAPDRTPRILLLPGRFYSRLTLGISRVDSW